FRSPRDSVTFLPEPGELLLIARVHVGQWFFGQNRIRAGSYRFANDLLEIAHPAGGWQHVRAISGTQNRLAVSVPLHVFGMGGAVPLARPVFTGCVGISEEHPPDRIVVTVPIGDPVLEHFPASALAAPVQNHSINGESQSRVVT